MLRIQDPPEESKQEEVRMTLDGLAQEGARQLLMTALEEEVSDYIERHVQERDEKGHALVVRNGRAQARKLTMGCGTMELEVCWFSVKMTARLDVNATPGVRMSPLAPGIVPECSGASRVKRATRAGFAALDTPSALWYSLVVGERERSGAPGIRVFMRALCYYAAHAAPLVPAPVSGPAPTRSLGPCQP